MLLFPPSAIDGRGEWDYAGRKRWPRYGADMHETERFLRKLGVTRPTVMVDRERVMANITAMAGKAKQSGASFRPHFKTHQCAGIGEWFRALGVRACTVSSLDMAEYFVRYGWDDITLALLVNPLEIDRLDDLAARIRLGVTVDSLAAVETLAGGLSAPVTVWLKIDAGYRRTGLWWEDTDDILAVARRVLAAEQLTLGGLLTHSGQTYQTPSIASIRAIHVETRSRLTTVRQQLESAGVEGLRISIGDTPGCSVVDDFVGIDEIRPGNFVFYDLMQVALGACVEQNLAVAVACPVIGRYPDRRQIVLHGGAVHFSKEFLPGRGGRREYGHLTRLAGEELGPIVREGVLVSLSQEHGILQCDDDLYTELATSELLLVYPVHACLTCDLFGEYLTLEGEVLPRRVSALGAGIGEFPARV